MSDTISNKDTACTLSHVNDVDDTSEAYAEWNIYLYIFIYEILLDGFFFFSF